jgi:hypothetical protein
LVVAGLLCAATLGVWGTIAVSGIGLIDLRFAALEWPSTVVPARLAGAQHRIAAWLRVASAPLHLAAGVFAVGRRAFLIDWHDPFLPPAGRSRRRLMVPRGRFSYRFRSVLPFAGRRVRRS